MGLGIGRKVKKLGRSVEKWVRKAVPKEVRNLVPDELVHGVEAVYNPLDAYQDLADDAMGYLIPDVELPEAPEIPEPAEPEFDAEAAALADAKRRAARDAKRRGRSALRIDLQPGAVGAGVFIPE